MHARVGRNLWLLYTVLWHHLLQDVLERLVVNVVLEPRLMRLPERWGERQFASEHAVVRAMVRAWPPSSPLFHTNP